MNEFLVLRSKLYLFIIADKILLLKKHLMRGILNVCVVKKFFNETVTTIVMTIN